MGERVRDKYDWRWPKQEGKAAEVHLCEALPTAFKVVAENEGSARHKCDYAS
jgi:hypothetical protein